MFGRNDPPSPGTGSLDSCREHDVGRFVDSATSNPRINSPCWTMERQSYIGGAPDVRRQRCNPWNFTNRSSFWVDRWENSLRVLLESGCQVQVRKTNKTYKPFWKLPLYRFILVFYDKNFLTYDNAFIYWQMAIQQSWRSWKFVATSLLWASPSRIFRGFIARTSSIGTRRIGEPP